MKRYLVAGLLVWLPLGVTLLVVRLLVNWLDGVMRLLPPQYQPEQLLGFHIPGLGVVLTVLVVLVTGMLVANFFGRKLVALWERLLSRIPLVRSVYSASKQLTETLFADSGQSFRQVVLVEFPRRESWTLAFVTGHEAGEVARLLGRDLVNLYVPTTPNPTSGYFIMVPRMDVIELDMSVDDGLKAILSMGAVMSPDKACALAEKAVKP
ncbi:MAG: DUF502 domain-containing protein [Gammaproteobacteria bacterium SHHR-1]|uniref:DUF502 domain-containing protein n=1 Tax=Magnetovirga frankeli TaxID=947516 RepID=UPI001294076D|nr:DUF502 domain-containing protein [gamma proteobacterium SS-5]